MRGRLRRSIVLAAISSVVIAGAMACSSLEPGDETTPQPPTPTEAPAATPTPSTSTSAPPAVPPRATLSTAELVELVQGSVVRVAIPSGVGSGFVVDPDGYIVTNHHVVENGLNNVLVTLDDGSTHSATVVGTDRSSDLAVLKIEAGRSLPPLELAELTNVVVGEDVVAIGYALDLTQGSGPPSVTRGIVSAKNRQIDPRGILGAVQTDAAINHGNSGGPLLNYEGKVVGVNTALAPTREGGVAQNIGFAVGSDTVRAVYEEILAKGQVDRAFLGIRSFSSLRPAEARALGIPETTRGILISENGVLPGGPANMVGVQPRDVIVRVGDHPIGDESDLSVAMIAYDPGQTVTVEIFRNGASIELELTLGTA
jgi:serine protease Do